MRIFSFIGALAGAVFCCSAAWAQQCPASKAPDHWAKAASALTAFAETGRAAGYASIADNRDKQGMSVGLLQWNFGQGTIADVIKGVANVDTVAAQTMPTYGARFLTEGRNSGSSDLRAAATKWIADVQAQDKAGINAEVAAFLNHPAVTASQDALAQLLATDAWNRAVEWMKDVRTGCRPYFGQFMVFFDYLNHGGVTNAAEIKQLVQAYGDTRDRYQPANRINYSRRIALGMASWVMAYPHTRPCQRPTGPRGGGEQAHVWDSQLNCALWKARIEGAEVWENEIFMLASLGAEFRPAQEIFVNRKGTFAFGIGAINGNECDFRNLYRRIERTTGPAIAPEETATMIRNACRIAQHAGGQ